jgi:PPOX class probable F420-dependent enzyme
MNRIASAVRGSAMEIDTSTDFGARVARHLEDDRIVWLATVDPDGTPQPSPVWFLWDGDTALIYSQAMTPKLRNIEQRPRVSLHFNCTPSGIDVVVLTGGASVDTGAPPVNANPAYLDKYADGISNIGMTPEAFAQAYSVPIRIRPTSLRGH